MCVYIMLYMYVCVYVYIYIYNVVCVCMYVYIYIHTHVTHSRVRTRASLQHVADCYLNVEARIRNSLQAMLFQRRTNTPQCFASYEIGSLMASRMNITVKMRADTNRSAS